MAVEAGPGPQSAPLDPYESGQGKYGSKFFPAAPTADLLSGSGGVAPGPDGSPKSEISPSQRKRVLEKLKPKAGDSPIDKVAKRAIKNGMKAADAEEAVERDKVKLGLVDSKESSWTESGLPGEQRKAEVHTVPEEMVGPPDMREVGDHPQAMVGRPDDIARPGEMPKYETEAFQELYDSVYNEGLTPTPQWTQDLSESLGIEPRTHTVDYDWAPLTQFVDDTFGGNLAKQVRRPMDFDKKAEKLARIKMALAQRRSKFGDNAYNREIKEKILDQKHKIEGAKLGLQADQIKIGKQQANTSSRNATTNANRLRYDKFMGNQANSRAEKQLLLDTRKVDISESAKKADKTKRTINTDYWKLWEKRNKSQIRSAAKELKKDPHAYLRLVEQATDSIRLNNPDMNVGDAIPQAMIAVSAQLKHQTKGGAKPYGSGLAEDVFGGSDGGRGPSTGLDEYGRPFGG